MPLHYDFILIDCHNLAYRHWWHLKDLRTSTGVYSGLEYGFFLGLLSLTKKYKPAMPVLVWDGIPQRCLEIFPVTENPDGTRSGYKANRVILEDKKKELDWIPRFSNLRWVLRSLVQTIYNLNTEADEEIARFCLQKNQNKKILICSRDKDLKQLITENCHLSMFEKQEETHGDIIYTPESIQQEFGIPAERLPLWRAITGDVSDGIPGVPRIPKTLISELVQASRDIDQLIQVIRQGHLLKTPKQREKLQASEALIRRNYSLMELLSQKSFHPSLYSPPYGDSRRVRELCVELEMESLRDREEWHWLEKIGSQSP